MKDDLISRQMAIDALERIFDRCEEIEAHLPDGDKDKTGYKMFTDYMTVWKYLHQLSSEERRDGWIPCSERLPSKADHKDDMVLVCYKNGAVRFNTYMNGWVQGEPVAWMPLPEPYKAGERSEDEW